MSDEIEIRLLTTLGSEIEPLITEAEFEGHRFVRRLLDEWQSNANRFDRTGEFLLGAFSEDKLIGVGGLNRDPYTEADDVGRLRHLYVLSTARRHRVGSLLVERVISQASMTFRILRLRTTTPEAAAFYCHVGFEEIREEAATHCLTLQHRS